MLCFDKELLNSIDYNLEREILLTNGRGGYTSTTLCGCNTRKYHGLMVSPIEQFGGQRHVLLSMLIESVELADKTFELSTLFSESKNLDGCKYIVGFEYFPIPTITFECDEFVLKKELLKLENCDSLMIRYTLIRAENHIHFKIRPLLAFRNSHELTHRNIFADTGYYPIVFGVKCRLYPGFPTLYMQTNLKSVYTYEPCWIENVSYEQERQRGYQWQEDLFCCGCFSIPMYQGESVIFSCSTRCEEIALLEQTFNQDCKRKNYTEDFIGCLRYSAEQFVATKDDKTEIIAGFPWFDSWGRDTFISLRGVLPYDDVETYIKVIDSMVAKMRNGLFPNTATAYNSADAPLWFFYALQRFEQQLNTPSVWRLYSGVMKTIIECYIRGTDDQTIKMSDNGLIETTSRNNSLTWMDAVVDGVPVTLRNGYAVEINALWYNALCFTMDKAALHREYKFSHRLKALCAKVKKSFMENFWSDKRGYLCDFVNDSESNTFIRPNMIIAASLPYTMLTDSQTESVFRVVTDKLLTPKGLRSLSADNPLYKGVYSGDQPTRDAAYHNGTVWVWLLEHYVRVGFRIYGADFVGEARRIVENFANDINSYGLASLPEIYDGDWPHYQRGAISQAWSVAAVLEIMQMIESNVKR